MPSVTALIAAGTSVGGAITSFAQASEQAAKIKAAEAAAEKAMAEAKKILDVNVYKGLEVEMLPFNLQREDLAALGGQAITAAQESGRGASETAGRVLAGAQEQEKAIATQLSGQMDALNKLTAAEESNLQKQKAELELAEVTGAQQAQADAERNMNAAIASGISSLADFGLTLYKESPLYGQKKGGDDGYDKWKDSLPSNLRTETDDYDLKGAFAAGLTPEKDNDGIYHLQSRDPKTGLILKNENHPTFAKAIEEDIKLGYLPYRAPNGRIYTLKGKAPKGYVPYVSK